METKTKRKYGKPGIVYCDFKTGEMTGSQWMIDKIIKETRELEQEQGAFEKSSLEDINPPCNIGTI